MHKILRDKASRYFWPGLPFNGRLSLRWQTRARTTFPILRPKWISQSSNEGQPAAGNPDTPGLRLRPLNTFLWLENTEIAFQNSVPLLWDLLLPIVCINCNFLPERLKQFFRRFKAVQRKEKMLWRRESPGLSSCSSAICYNSPVRIHFSANWPWWWWWWWWWWWLWWWWWWWEGFVSNDWTIMGHWYGLSLLLDNRHLGAHGRPRVVRSSV